MAIKQQYPELENFLAAYLADADGDIDDLEIARDFMSLLTRIKVSAVAQKYLV